MGTDATPASRRLDAGGQVATSSGTIQHRYPASPLQQGRRRFVRQRQRLRRDKVGMLQCKPAAQGGVTGNVGEDQPGGPGREGPEALRTVLLKLVVGLEEIVE